MDADVKKTELPLTAAQYDAAEEAFAAEILGAVFLDEDAATKNKVRLAIHQALRAAWEAAPDVMEQPEVDMPPNPPGIGGVNAAYFIKRLDDARLAKRGVYEAKTLVFTLREVEVLKAILRRTEQAFSRGCADCDEPLTYGLQAVAVESGKFVCRKCWGKRNGRE